MLYAGPPAGTAGAIGTNTREPRRRRERRLPGRFRTCTYTVSPREVEQPFDYAALKAAYRDAGGQGRWMVNNGYTRALALEAVASGYADMVAFGRDFIANPDLVERLRQDAPLNPGQRDTYYGGGVQGYTDYPTLSA